MKISEFLKEERTKRCLTQQEMADCLGVSQSTYATYEKAWVNPKRNQKRIPGKITARRIAMFTGKSSEYINELIENEKGAVMEEDIEMLVYKKLCSTCPYAKKCHEECETCDEYEDEIERLKKEN